MNRSAIHNDIGDDGAAAASASAASAAPQAGSSIAIVAAASSTRHPSAAAAAVPIPPSASNHGGGIVHRHPAAPTGDFDKLLPKLRMEGLKALNVEKVKEYWRHLRPLPRQRADKDTIGHGKLQRPWRKKFRCDGGKTLMCVLREKKGETKTPTPKKILFFVVDGGDDYVPGRDRKPYKLLLTEGESDSEDEETPASPPSRASGPAVDPPLPVPLPVAGPLPPPPPPPPPPPASIPLPVVQQLLGLVGFQSLLRPQAPDPTTLLLVLQMQQQQQQLQQMQSALLLLAVHANVPRQAQTPPSHPPPTLGSPASEQQRHAGERGASPTQLEGGASSSSVSSFGRNGDDDSVEELERNGDGGGSGGDNHDDNIGTGVLRNESDLDCRVASDVEHDVLVGGAADPEGGDGSAPATVDEAVDESTQTRDPAGDAASGEALAAEDGDDAGIEPVGNTSVVQEARPRRRQQASASDSVSAREKTTTDGSKRASSSGASNGPEPAKKRRCDQEVAGAVGNIAGGATTTITEAAVPRTGSGTSAVEVTPDSRSVSGLVIGSALDAPSDVHHASATGQEVNAPGLRNVDPLQGSGGIPDGESAIRTALEGTHGTPQPTARGDVVVNNRDVSVPAETGTLGSPIACQNGKGSAGIADNCDVDALSGTRKALLELLGRLSVQLLQSTTTTTTEPLDYSTLIIDSQSSLESFVLVQASTTEVVRRLLQRVLEFVFDMGDLEFAGHVETVTDLLWDRVRRSNNNDTTQMSEHERHKIAALLKLLQSWLETDAAFRSPSYRSHVEQALNDVPEWLRSSPS